MKWGGWVEWKLGGLRKLDVLGSLVECGGRGGVRSLDGVRRLREVGRLGGMGRLGEVVKLG